MGHMENHWFNSVILSSEENEQPRTGQVESHHSSSKSCFKTSSELNQPSNYDINSKLRRSFQHCLALSYSDLSVWCYACNGYVKHDRLIPCLVKAGQ